MKRKTWLIVIIVIVVAIFGSAGFLLLSHDGGALTVSESVAMAGSSARLSVEGKVAPGSVVWDSQARLMTFVLTDGRENLKVVYQGIVPDHFKVGAELTVSGKYRPDGVLEASSFSSSMNRSICAICH